MAAAQHFKLVGLSETQSQHSGDTLRGLTLPTWSCCISEALLVSHHCHLVCNSTKDKMMVNLCVNCMARASLFQAWISTRAPTWSSLAVFSRVMLRYPWLAAAEGWSAPSRTGAGSTRHCWVSCSGLLSAVISHRNHRIF